MGADAVAVARQAFAAGEMRRALLLMRPAAEAEPGNLDAAFVLGMAAAALARRASGGPEARRALLGEAIAAFRRVLDARPGLPRPRLELARALFDRGRCRKPPAGARELLEQLAGGDCEAAAHHFRLALAGDLPPAAAARVGRLLSVLRARKRVSASFGVALAPDSNLNSASAERTIWLDTPWGRLPFRRGAEAGPKSGVGLSVQGGGEYRYPLGPRTQLRTGANASMREYKGRAFDSHAASAHVGPRRLIDAETEASLLATVERQWIAGAPETDRYGLRLEAGRRLGRRLVLQGAASWRESDCRNCDWSDGPVTDLSLDAFWTVLPVLRVDTGAGYGWTRTEARHLRHAVRHAHLGASLAMSGGFTLGARVWLGRTGYEGGGALHRTIDRKAREDRTRRLSLSVSWRGAAVFGFSPRLALHNERRETNAQALGYRRNYGELSFFRHF